MGGRWARWVGDTRPVELQPPDFVDAAREREEWTGQDWRLWTNVGRPNFEEEFRVDLLQLRPGLLEASGEAATANALEYVRDTDEKPVLEALERLGMALRRLAGRAEAAILARLDPDGRRITLDRGFRSASLVLPGLDAPLVGSGKTHLEALQDLERVVKAHAEETTDS